MQSRPPTISSHKAPSWPYDSGGTAAGRRDHVAATPADRALYEGVKRLIDVAVALTALVVLSPLLLLLAVVIKLYSAGPALFVQERVGWDERAAHGRIFRMYKFRSMRANSDPDSIASTLPA